MDQRIVVLEDKNAGLMKENKSQSEAIEKLKDQSNRQPIKTWSRKSTIIPEFVGYSFLIYNGKKFIPIKISEEMVGHKLGEFSPTRQFSGHTPADKKAAQVASTVSSSTTTTKPGVTTPKHAISPGVAKEVPKNAKK